MQAFIRDPYALARAQLETPGERPAPEPMAAPPEAEGPRPGPPSPDAPGALRAVRVTATRVELEWEDHAEGEVAFVMQRCRGDDNQGFRNAVGQGGADLTRAVDREVEAGASCRSGCMPCCPHLGDREGRVCRMSSGLRSRTARSRAAEHRGPGAVVPSARCGRTQVIPATRSATAPDAPPGAGMGREWRLPPRGAGPRSPRPGG